MASYYIRFCLVVIICCNCVVKYFANSWKLIFDWYNQFILEEKYGFNKSTKKLWILDKVKGIVLGFSLSYLLLALLIWMYRLLSFELPQIWWIIVFFGIFIIQLLMMVLFPKLILPLFNKLTPLDEGELKDRLMKLSDKTGFKANSIEVIDGSKRSGIPMLILQVLGVFAG